MSNQLAKILVLSLASFGLAAAACAGSAKQTAVDAPTAAPAKAAGGLRIAHTAIYVNDQEKALRFYTEVVGMVKKDDESAEGYRWITVVAPGHPDGTELQLALDSDPAAKAYAQAMFAKDQAAVMLYTDDINGDYERMKARGAAFKMPPTEVYPGSTIATLPDNCGNLVQLTQIEK